jgi:hypothetical protein
MKMKRIKTTVTEQLRKALGEIGGEPLKGSGFEDEARRRSRADINDAEVARLLRELERVAKLLYCLRGCGLDPKGAWPDC